MTASFLGGAVAAKPAAATTRRGQLAVRASMDSEKAAAESSNTRRGLVLAVVAAAASSVAKVAMADEPKRGSLEAKKNKSKSSSWNELADCDQFYRLYTAKDQNKGMTTYDTIVDFITSTTFEEKPVTIKFQSYGKPQTQWSDTDPISSLYSISVFIEPKGPKQSQSITATSEHLFWISIIIFLRRGTVFQICPMKERTRTVIEIRPMKVKSM
ncbi:putative late blight resistance protein R1A-10 isoform X3 [Salvia divinorum]|uniref:Late blight resistance protein R1A-10 isoform X3 n=1 Tax=Salvia divinorum TaxID=28513 RepID=A0ABD1GFG8_SALDI